MYGLIGKMTAVSGQRAALVEILQQGTQNMPGCHSYIIAHDLAEADVIWVTEIWENKASHEASLQLPAVRDAIGKGRPLIAAMAQIAHTEPANV